MAFGAAALALGACVALINGIPSLRKRRNGGVASGIPILGNVLAGVALIATFGSLAVPLGALAVYLLDVGGIPWFVRAVWNDPTFWEGTKRRSPPG